MMSCLTMGVWNRFQTDRAEHKAESFVFVAELSFSSFSFSFGFVSDFLFPMFVQI